MTEAHVNPLPRELQVLACAGWKFFPLRHRSKLSLIEAWPQAASSSLDQLRTWSVEFPGCNWAALSGEKFFVLDCDGRSGEKWLEAQYARYGVEWSDTLQVTTGGGGCHLYFAAPNFTIQNSAGKIHAGVDLRGWHGCTVVPPSVHENGVAYSWRTPFEHSILPAPTWLLDTIRSVQGGTPAKRASGNGKGESRLIPEGERNATLASLAGSMRRRGMGQESIRAALLSENADACSPPLDEQEVETIAASVSRYEPESQLRPRPITRSEAGELFETASQFAAQAPTRTEWIVPPWVPASGIVELVGKIKASGKTTFALAMVGAVLGGTSFLDRPCAKSPVVYLTEQPETSLREALVRASLLGRDDLFLMRWHKAMGKQWAELAHAATAKAEQVGARLLVVDTLSQFAQLLGDAENNSGQALEVLRPLQAAQEKGIAVLLVRHEKKGAAEIADAGRGSSAFAGAVDVLLRLRRLGATHPATYRKLETLSRFDETPADSIVELTPDGYRLHDVAAVVAQGKRSTLLTVLPKDENEAKTCRDLALATGQPRSTLQRTLTELVNAGSVIRLGPGIHGCAYRYFRKGSERDDLE